MCPDMFFLSVGVVLNVFVCLCCCRYVLLGCFVPGIVDEVLGLECSIISVVLEFV